MVKRLVLVGGGHAHLLVLEQLRDFISRSLEVTLVTPHPAHLYSGMIPGVVAGHYPVAAAQINLARLAALAGAELVLDSAVSLISSEKQVLLNSGRAIAYDVLSLNPGAAPNFGGVPGAAEHAIAAKPFAPFLEWWNRIRASKPRVAVVGAGAAGVELAMAMRFAGAQVALHSDKLQFPAGAGERILAALKGLGVAIHVGRPVTSVEPGHTVWTAGAAPPALIRESGLKKDAAGFVLVDSALRSVSHPEVFAAGDTASLDGTAVPKSGVYAVRQGAVLARNLKSVLQGEIPRDFRPRPSSLALISCGGKYAIAARGSWSAEGAWAWHWKDWIDRRWIARFR